MLKHFSSFRRQLVFTAVLVMLAILAIAFLGPLLGLSRNLIIWAIGALVALSILFFIIQLSIRRRRAAREARRLGGFHVRKKVSEESADETLGARLARTIHWLRKSEWAESGRDVVYELPWYVLLGPQSSGKSTLVVQSGCTFSYTEPVKKTIRPQVTPTVDWDLWVANEALFIDVSGKYFSKEHSISSWRSALCHVKEYRKRKPIDGILVVVDVVSLVKLDHDGLREQAGKLRGALEMAMDEFEMVFPVYLIFNKCDLIEGFEEFFSEGADHENRPVGATFSRDQFRSPQPEREFEVEFDRLYQSILSYRMAFLLNKRRQIRDKAFAFPKQLLLARDQLSEFVGILFQHSRFREKPIFRGFYFTSGVQGGQSLDLVADLLKAKVGLPTASVLKKRQDVKSHFFKPLLTQVVLMDRNLAGVSSYVKRRRLFVRIAITGLVGVVLPLLVLLKVWGAYKDNDGLINATRGARTIAVEGGATSENIQALTQLRKSLEKFECRPQLNTCWTDSRRFHWGMYAGQQMVTEARRIYLERLNQLFLDQLINGDTTLGHSYDGIKTALRMMTPFAPEKISDSDLMREFDPGQAYTLLKIFLMFSDESKADPRFLEAQTLDYWSLAVEDQDKPDARELLRFYLHQLGDHRNSAYRLSRSLADTELVKRVREPLLVIDSEVYYYDLIQLEGESRLNSVNLAGILGGQNTRMFDAGSKVDGVYTKVGWETFVKDRIIDIKADFETERSWVLGVLAADPGQPKIDEKVRTYYFRDYEESWWNFLRGIKVIDFVSFQDASEVLKVLSDSGGSPIFLLLKSVSVNTWEGLGGPDSQDPGRLREALSRAPQQQVHLAKKFESIHEFVEKRENQGSPLDQYLKALSGLQVSIQSFLDANEPIARNEEIGRQAEAALNVTNGFLVGFDENSRQAVEPLLKQPLRQVLALVDKRAPVGAEGGDRRRSLSAGGILRRKGTTVDGATVSLLEFYSDDRYEAAKEIMTAKTQEGAFRFPRPVQPGLFKICVSGDGQSHYCADVRLGRESDKKIYELKRPRKLLVLGGGKLELTLSIR